MKRRIKSVLPRLKGKTIAHAIIKEGTSPRAQLFLVFTDNTYYEFYSESPINGSSDIDVGGFAAAVAHSGQKIVFVS